MTRIIVAVALILCFFAVTLVLAQRRNRTEPPTAPEGVTVHRDLAYVTNGHERQKLDLYVPNEGETYRSSSGCMGGLGSVAARNATHRWNISNRVMRVRVSATV